MAASNTTWRARFVSARAPLLLAVLTLLVYANSFTGGFTLDSKQAILNDQRVHELSDRNVGLILDHTYWWPYDQSGLYRPLATFSYLFNYAVLGNGDAPFGYHAVNLLLHLANVLLVYAVARRFTTYALPAAAIWAVHPVLTESVTNIVGRADLLAAFGMLLALWFYTARPRAWFWGMIGATALAVFSKESAVVLPALLPLFDRDRRLLRGLVATAIPIAAMLAQRASVLSSAMARHVPFTDNPIVAADFLHGRLAALSVLGRYVWLLCWPAKLSADYSWAQIPAVADWAAIATLAAVLTVGLVWNWRVLAFAVLLLLPMSNLIFPIGTIMAERFLYIPAIAFALAVASVWRWRAGRVAICLVVACLAARTWTRNPDWHDDYAMAESIVRAAPHSYKGHRLLAWELYQREGVTARVLSEADKSVAPLQNLPDVDNSPDTWRQAGGYYAAAHQYPRAVELLERCLRIVHEEKLRIPDSSYAGMPSVLDNLATAYAALGRRDDAAITLMVGNLTTGDQSFRARLLDLYKGVDCALTAGPNGPAINPQCPVVHDHLCAAIARAGTTAESAAYGCKK